MKKNIKNNNNNFVTCKYLYNFIYATLNSDHKPKVRIVLEVQAHSSSSSESSSQIGSYSDINEKAKEFINRGSKSETISQQKVEQDLKPLAQILMGIAVLVLLSVGAILGVKYMISGADERAKNKEKIIWYIVSAVLIFGAVAIFNIVIKYY